LLHINEKGVFIGGKILVTRGRRLCGGLSRGCKPCVIDNAFTNSFVLYHPRDGYENDANEVGWYSMHENSMYNAPHISSSSESFSEPEGLFIVSWLIKAIRHTKSCLDVALSFVTDVAKPMMQSARSAMPQMNLSEAHVAPLSIMMPVVFVNMKLTIVISLRMMALMQVWCGRPNWNSSKMSSNCLTRRFISQATLIFSA
jgi:hypothetical protein